MNDRKNYGWLVCFAGVLVLLCSGGLSITGFSVYYPFLIKIAGLTNTQTSSLSMIKNLFTLLGMMSAGFVTGKIGHRLAASGGVFMVTIAFLIHAFIGNYTGYVIGSALIGYFYGATSIITVSVVVTRWFNKHRGLAIGICMSATGLSSVLASGTVTYLITNYSLATAFVVEAMFCALCAVIIFVIVRDNPSDIGAKPIGGDSAELSAASYAARDTAEKNINIMAFGVMCFGMAVLTVLSSVSVLYSSEGFTQEKVSLLLSVMGICLAGGKCIFGLIADRIGALLTARIFYVIFCLGLFLGCFASNHSMVMALAAVSCMACGVAIPTVSTPLYASGMVTEKKYSGVVTRFQMAHTMGGIVFGTVPGIIADRTGSYIPTFIMITIIAAVSAVLVQVIYYKILQE